MNEFCDGSCDDCAVRKVFGYCPRGVIEDSEIERVLNAVRIGYEEGLRVAEQAVEHVAAAEANSRKPIDFFSAN